MHEDDYRMRSHVRAMANPHILYMCGHTEPNPIGTVYLECKHDLCSSCLDAEEREYGDTDEYWQWREEISPTRGHPNNKGT